MRVALIFFIYSPLYRIYGFLQISVFARINQIEFFKLFNQLQLMIINMLPIFCQSRNCNYFLSLLNSTYNCTCASMCYYS